MTDSVDTFLYACPRCQAKLTTRREYAGKRVKCPKCESVVKVPAATPGAATAAADAPAATTTRSAAGITNISLVCPQCRATLTATTDQIGQEIICGDCLEGVKVVAPEALPPAPPPLAPPTPAISPPLSPPPANSPMDASSETPLAPTAPESTLPLAPIRPIEPPSSPPSDAPPAMTLTPLAGSAPEAGSATPPSSIELGGGGDPLDIGDDIVLQPPEDLANRRPDIMDSIKAAEAMSDAKFGGVDDAAQVPLAPLTPLADAPDDVEFGFSCKVCDTRLHALPSQEGQTLKCPDCFIENTVPKAPTKARQPSLTDASDDFGLGAATEPTFPGANTEPKFDTSPVNTASKLLAEAEAELEKEHRDVAEFDAEPPALLMISFLADPAALLTVIFCGTSFGLWLTGIGLIFSDDTMMQMFGMLGSLAMSLLSLVALAFLMGACLAIVTETSAGNRKIEGWPGVDVGEWLFNVLAIFNPLWMSGLPGLAFGALVATVTGSGMGFVFIFLSWFALFPIVMHAMNETQSIINPFSIETLRSVQKHPKQWGMFYAASILLLLPLMAIFCGTIFLGTSIVAIVTNLLGCMVIVPMMLIYFRLFGWHIWRLNELDTGAYKHRTAGKGLYEAM